MDLDKIKEIWDKEATGLNKPRILIAKDINNKYYYVIKDNSSIIFMVFKDSNITYSIPKKYLRKEIDYYFITNNNKLIPVSCLRRKNEYEIFVQKFLLPK